jgi:4-amino-4-deoxy-L-arabinose transferase-like glycosyltransferase
MRQDVRYQLWIVAAAGVIFFTNLGGPALFDMDEALYTTCAREMLGRHNWVVPWFNGQMFPEKPPLMFWTMMAGFEVLGVNEWGARFFSAVMGLGTALAAFHLGRILFSPRVGLWAGLITASTIIFTISARAATVDSALTFVTTLSFLMFAIGWKEGSGARDQGPGGRERRRQGDKETRRQGQISSLIPHPSSLIHHPSSLSFLPSPLSPLYAIPMYVCIGLAALAKGPVGVVLPLAAMGLFLLVTRGWRNLFRSAWWMRPFTALVIVSAVAVPWYVWVGLETHWELPMKFLVEYNLRPFKQPILGHGDVSSFDRAMAALVSALYYFYQIPAILCGFFPWSVFLLPTILETIRCIRRRDGQRATPIWRDGCVLAACWFGVWFLFWSICKTKLPHYLLPAYPALALLTACFVDRWLSEPASLGHWVLRNAWISTILVGIGIIIALPIVATIYLPGEQWLGLIGLILVLGGGWCWRATARGWHNRAAVGFAVTSVVFLTAIFGFAVLRVDKYQNAKPMIAAIRADYGQQGPLPIATYQFFRESTVYYAGNPVTKCDDVQVPGQSAQQGLAQFLTKSQRAYVITTDEHEREINEAFPGKFKKIFDQRRFLGPGEMIVLRSRAVE